MNWYKKAQNVANMSEFLNNFKPQSLRGLASEALKNNTFDDFEKDYIIQIKHGTYWHITDNPNFTIDPNKGPRDMSSLATGKETPGKLMVTTHLENWIAEYPDRKYAAEIDMSQVNKKDYYQVKRGFGNEFWVDNPSNAKVIRVLPINKALQLSKYRHNKLPQSQESLEQFFQNIHEQYQKYLDDKNKQNIMPLDSQEQYKKAQSDSGYQTQPLNSIQDNKQVNVPTQLKKPKTLKKKNKK